jgi:hypothetical protein
MYAPSSFDHTSVDRSYPPTAPEPALSLAARAVGGVMTGVRGAVYDTLLGPVRAAVAVVPTLEVRDRCEVAAYGTEPERQSWRLVTDEPQPLFSIAPQAYITQVCPFVRLCVLLRVSPCGWAAGRRAPADAAAAAGAPCCRFRRPPA